MALCKTTFNITSHMTAILQEGHRHARKSTRKATKMIQKSRDISYEIPLRECGLTILRIRRLRGDQKVFKN